MALSLLLASGVALAAGVGTATADSSVVGPGESIQKAINAADPGDTIVVRGVHREDVAIRKDGIKLRGDDAVIEPPARADTPCSRAFGPEAICVLGDVNLDTFEVKSRVEDVSVSGFTIRGLKGEGEGRFAISVVGARNTTVVGNRATGNVTGGIIASVSIGTTVANNDVIGNPKSGDSGIFAEEARNTTVVNNNVRNIPEGEIAIEAVESIDTTIAGNDLKGNYLGVFLVASTGTKALSNDVSHTGLVGIFVRGQESADAKIVGNNISGGPWGIYVTDTFGDTHSGSIAGNTIHDNCAGMYFESYEDNGLRLVGDFEVKANTIEDNTRSCRAAQFGTNFSGIGIALLGARELEVTGNQISGNVPSGPTAVSGGVVVATDPFSSVTIKPKNNTVTGNNFGNNKPDIFWDGTGSGNVLRPNNCDKSVPSRLCN